MSGKTNQNIPESHLETLEKALQVVHDEGYNTTNSAYDALQALREGRGTKSDLHAVTRAIKGLISVDFGVECFEKSGLSRDSIYAAKEAVKNHLK